MTALARDDAPALSLPRAMLTVFAPFCSGFFLGYFFRSVNALIAPQLRENIGVGPTELGLLSAVLFFTFAAAQLPLGILLDRFGPRRVQGVLFAVAAAGGALFAIGENVTTLLIGRALIGLGVAGGLMGGLKAVVLWFPPQRIATVNGWYLATGGLGAMFATAPAEFALGFTDWRGLTGIAAGLFLLASLAILVVVPERPKSGPQETVGDLMSAVGRIFSDRYFWRIVPLMFTGSGANMAIQGLWAGPLMTDVHGMDSAAVARHLFAITLGMTTGFFASGWLATHYQRLGGSLPGFCAGGLAFQCLVIAVVVLGPPEVMLPAMFGIGVGATLTTPVFAALVAYFPMQFAGRVNTAANLLVFVMSFSFQFGMGAMIDLWTPLAEGRYPAEAYITTFFSVIAVQLCALAWYALFRTRPAG